MNEADDDDYRRDAIDARRAKAAARCQCGDDMQGTCPGPAFCPMCDDDAADE